MFENLVDNIDTIWSEVCTVSIMDSLVWWLGRTHMWSGTLSRTHHKSLSRNQTI